jgi:hypothetical protein
MLVAGHYISRDQAVVWFDAVAEAVVKHVKDRDVKRAIWEDLRPLAR